MSSQSQYENIAHDLREGIVSGQYRPGALLPAMRDVAERYGVSNITVRKAYKLLASEGLVEGRGRGGTIVLDHPDHVVLEVRDRQMERDSLGYYSGPQVQHWRALPWADGEHTRVIQTPVPADIARVLGIEGQAELTVRRRLVGDPTTPEHRQLADTWFPDWLVQELPVVTGNTGLGGVYDRIEEWAGQPLAWREEVSARIPSPAEAEALNMPSTGVPLLRVLRVTSVDVPETGEHRVVEVQDIRMSAGLYAVGYPLPRGSSATWPVSPATSDYYKAPTIPDTSDPG